MQGPLFFWSYIYYLSKYYEFIDTALLVIKVRLAGLSLTLQHQPATYASSTLHVLVCCLGLSVCKVYDIAAAQANAA